MMITQDRVDAYIAGGGLRCFHCGNKAVSAGGQFEVSGTSIWQEVICGDCGYEWRDLYTLTGAESQTCPNCNMWPCACIPVGSRQEASHVT